MHGRNAEPGKKPVRIAYSIKTFTLRKCVKAQGMLAW